MKNKKLWLSILSIFIVGVVLAGIGFVYNGEKIINGEAVIEGDADMFTIFGNKKHLVSSKDIEVYNVDIGEFNSFDISLVAEDIEFIKSDEFKLEINDFKDEKDKTIQYSNNNGKLVVKRKSNVKIGFNFNFNSTLTYLKVYYKDDINFDNSLVSTISGNININNLNVDNLNISSTSGDIISENIKCNDLSINTISGNTKFSKINSNKSDFNSTSGDISISDCNANELKASSISGNVTLTNNKINDTIKTNTTSGDIRGNDNECDEFKSESISGAVNLDNFTVNEIDSDSTSGDITFNIKGNQDDYSIDFDSTSGDLAFGDIKSSKNFEIKKGSKNISIDTMSGDCKIYFK